jgi:hypothetical protein
MWTILITVQKNTIAAIHLIYKFTSPVRTSSERLGRLDADTDEANWRPNRTIPATVGGVLVLQRFHTAVISGSNPSSGG